MSNAPAPGTPIDRDGKYVLRDLLGVGGMAEVYRGYTAGEAGFRRTVAIKRVLSSYSDNAAFATMFISEARLASLLNHPCVVAVLDFSRDREGRLFQVIEYVDGVDLDKLMRPDADLPRAPGPILPDDVTSYILGEVLSGLHHAHTAVREDGKPLGIIHRDCTPSNVLISWEGAVKLSDFGVAKAMALTDATQSGSAKGKPAYMAPEQITGSASMDARVDLFAVGVILYELLVGRRPIDADNVQAMIFAVAEYGRGALVVPSAFEATGGTAHEGLSRLAARLMAPHPDNRPATAHDALVELRHVCSPANRTDLQRILARRWHNRAPRSAAELETPAYSLPTNIQAARAAAVAASRATVGHTPSPVGDLSRVAASRSGSRRALAVALAAIAVAFVTVTVAVMAGGGDPAVVTAPRADAVTVPIDGETAVDAGAPIDATPALDVVAPVDAAPVDAVPADAAPVDAGAHRRRASVRDAGRKMIDTDLKGGGS